MPLLPPLLPVVAGEGGRVVVVVAAVTGESVVGVGVGAVMLVVIVVVVARVGIGVRAVTLVVSLVLVGVFACVAQRQRCFTNSLGSVRARSSY